MSNTKRYYNDDELQKTIVNHDHFAYEVTLVDNLSQERKENFIARNIQHLIFALGEKGNTFESYHIKEIKELAYCPTVFILQNVTSAMRQLDVVTDKMKEKV